ncbi:hypothetical protein Z949_951 [Sulfitobacter guttiformis KCTC 32187]|nr:hypothetical protein Z949_951 [Sulfitobacter guttiformis KCTC 32187]
MQKFHEIRIRSALQSQLPQHKVTVVAAPNCYGGTMTGDDGTSGFSLR